MEYATDDTPDLPGLVGLPSGVSEVKMVKNVFMKCLSQCKRMEEIFYNLNSACGHSREQLSFAREWLPKLNTVCDIEAHLGQLEAALLKLSGGTGRSLPSFLTLTTVKAANKIRAGVVVESKPQDVREKRRARKRNAGTMLAKLQTPLVEANRPNKQRQSERSRHQANYEARRKRFKVPEELHPQVDTQREDSKEPLT